MLIGNDKLSASAQRQVTAYANGRNGLANNGRDDFGWRPDPLVTFTPHVPSRGTNIDHAVSDLQAAAKANRDKPVRFRRIKAALTHLTESRPSSRILSHPRDTNTTHKEIAMPGLDAAKAYVALIGAICNRPARHLRPRHDGRPVADCDRRRRYRRGHLQRAQPPLAPCV